MSVEFIFRLIGMVLLAVVGVYWGVSLGRIAGAPEDLYAVVIGLVGALAGLVLTPFVTTRPARTLRQILGRVAATTLVSGLIGLMAGLIIAALLAFPLSLLPSPVGDVLPFIGVLLFGYFGVVVFVMRKEDLFSMLTTHLPGRIESGEHSGDGDEEEEERNVSRTVLLDTSVIIDGRIADIARTGFLSGTLLIPRFVLNELQYIADSSDSLRRQRGRRGMEVLSQLQKDTVMPGPHQRY